MSMKWERKILQNRSEMDWFCKLIKQEGVKSYLEIGCKHGGSLGYVATKGLPSGSRVAAVDLPHGDGSFKESQPPLEECCNALRSWGYDVHLFIGDSMDPEIKEKVGALAPFDLCFIDANHTEPYVRHDWGHYGQLARMVAFHDINWKARPEPSKKMPIEVPVVWEELKKQYRHQEIRLDARDNGIGVLWR